jgi:hypothetical protein
MIGQLHSVVLDARDLHALATFHAGLLGMAVKGAPGGDVRVYADPVGHPCCLVWDVA